MAGLSNLFKKVKHVPSDFENLIERGGVLWPDGTIVISVLNFVDWENRVYQGENYKEKDYKEKEDK